MVTTIVKALADNMEGTTEVKSGENLKADVIRTNKIIKREEERKAGWAGQEEETVDPNLQNTGEVTHGDDASTTLGDHQ